MADYTAFADARVKLTYTGSSGEVTEEGTVRRATPDGIQFQPKKGKSQLLLNHEISNVERVEVATKQPAQIKATRVNPVTASTVKRHLASSHGLLLGDVNAMTTEEALVVHQNHHDRHGDNAPHFHAERSAGDAVESE